MRYKKMRCKTSFLALICALSLVFSTCAQAEISKSREYEVEEVYGDDGKKINITERNPEDEDNFDPEGTVVKDSIFDYPDSEQGQVTVKISIPEGTKGISVYVKDGGWHKVKITVKKRYITVPIKNHKRHKVIVHRNGKSPKTGEQDDSFRLIKIMNGLLIGAASIGAIICYRKKETY